MLAEDMKTFGRLTIFAGILVLITSGYRAYVFPFTPTSSTDLGTILAQVWQVGVITISLTIFGILAVLTGTMLYGFGRLAEEIQVSEARDQTPDKSDHH